MRGFPRTRDCQRNRYRCDGWCGPAALYRWRTSDLAGLDPSSLDLRQLKRNGVELTLDTMVTDVDDAGGTQERVTSEGNPAPGLGPAATQEGHHAARNIIRTIRR